MWKRISSSVSISSKTNEHIGNELDSCSLSTKDDESKVIDASITSTSTTAADDDDDDDSRNNIGLNIDDEDDDEVEELEELENLQGKLFLMNDALTLNGVDEVTVNGNGEIVQQKKETSTTAIPNLFLLNEHMPPLIQITPPLTSEPVISSTTTSNIKAVTDGMIKRIHSSNSIMKKEKSSNSLLSSTSFSSTVRFGSIEIHEMGIELGSSVPLTGPSLTLSWERLSYQKLDSIDDHQQQQQQENATTKSAAKRNDDCIRPLPAEERIDRLLEHGYTLREIRSSVRDSGKERTKRIQSLRKSCTYDVKIRRFDLKRTFSRLFTCYCKNDN